MTESFPFPDEGLLLSQALFEFLFLDFTPNMFPKTICTEKQNALTTKAEVLKLLCYSSLI